MFKEETKPSVDNSYVGTGDVTNSILGDNSSYEGGDGTITLEFLRQFTEQAKLREDRMVERIKEKDKEVAELNKMFRELLMKK